MRFRFKFKINFKDILLNIATFAVIALSIYLWVTVMTSDQRFSQISNGDSTQSLVTVNSRYRGAQAFYTPGQVYSFKNGVRYQVHDAQENLTLKFVQKVEKLGLGKIEKMSTATSDYQKLLDDSNYIHFAYPDQINFSLLLGKKKTNSGLLFNRVFVPIKSNLHYLYFGNDIGTKIYRMRIMKGSLTKLVSYVQKAEDQQKVFFLHLKNRYVPFYSKAVSVKEYSYLISYQASSYYASKLLGSSYRKSVAKNGQTVYTSDYSQRLQLPLAGKNSDHQYLYQSYQTKKSRTMTQQLLESAAYVRKLGLTEQDLRFFEADGHEISYVNFVEGYPLFVNDQLAQAQVTFKKESVSVSFNNLNLQIPIPYDGHKKKLLKTASLLKELTEIGIKESQIQEIMIGYHIKNDAKRSDLITLVPTYFIKVNGKWNSLEGWKQAKTNPDILTDSSANIYSSFSSSSSSNSSSSSSAMSSSTAAASSSSATGQAPTYQSSSSQASASSSSSSAIKSSSSSSSSSTNSEGDQ